MNQKTIDDEMRSELVALKPETEFRDGDGNVIGYFVCPEIYWSHKLVYQKYEEVELAELEERAKSNDVGTLQELWDELGIQCTTE